MNRFDAIHTVINKLAKLDTLVKNSGSITGELDVLVASIIRAAQQALGDTSILTSQPNILPGEYPDPAPINEFFRNFSNDLSTLYTAIDQVEKIIVESFNIASVTYNTLNQKLKKARNLLASAAISFNQGMNIVFTDTFNSSDNYEIDDKSAFIDHAAGVVVLPFDIKDVEVADVSKISVSSDRGNAGNFQELGRETNNDPMAMVDGDVDTWFEYELVSDEEVVPLTLDLNFELSSPKVINKLDIVPNNFGTSSWLKILDISTSVDGITFHSIKDFLSAEGFVLSPAMTKFEGEGHFYFPPRVAGFIKISFEQSSPYVINTAEGEKLRYAIGIREVAFQGIKFSDQAELVSKDMDIKRAITILSCIMDSWPLQSSTITIIGCEVSFDGGQAWHKLDPMNFDESFTVDVKVYNKAAKVPQRKRALSINSGEADSIKMDSAPTTLKYRLKLSKDEEAIEKLGEHITEIKQELTTLTREFTPDHKLTGDAILVFEALPFGETYHDRYDPLRMGKLGVTKALSSQKTDIAGITTTISTERDVQRVQLPLLLNSYDKSIFHGSLRVLIDNDPWTVAVKNIFYDNVYKWWRYDTLNSQLIFGTGINYENDLNYNYLYGGRLPPSGQDIKACVSGKIPCRFIPGEPGIIRSKFQFYPDVDQILVAYGGINHKEEITHLIPDLFADSGIVRYFINEVRADLLVKESSINLTFRQVARDSEDQVIVGSGNLEDYGITDIVYKEFINGQEEFVGLAVGYVYYSVKALSDGIEIYLGGNKVDEILASEGRFPGDIISITYRKSVVKLINSDRLKVKFDPSYPCYDLEVAGDLSTCLTTSQLPLTGRVCKFNFPIVEGSVKLISSNTRNSHINDTGKEVRFIDGTQEFADLDAKVRSLTYSVDYFDGIVYFAAEQVEGQITATTSSFYLYASLAIAVSTRKMNLLSTAQGNTLIGLDKKDDGLKITNLAYKMFETCPPDLNKMVWYEGKTNELEALKEYITPIIRDVTFVSTQLDEVDIEQGLADIFPPVQPIITNKQCEEIDLRYSLDRVEKAVGGDKTYILIYGTGLEGSQLVFVPHQSLYEPQYIDYVSYTVPNLEVVKFPEPLRILAFNGEPIVGSVKLIDKCNNELVLYCDYIPGETVSETELGMIECGYQSSQEEPNEGY